MRWDVAVKKAMGAGPQRFELDVAFRSDATRLVLFGPSGAGKTLTLKAMAGLLRPESGHVRLSGETLFDASAAIDLPARRRGIGYLFQEYALFPHLNVRQNVAFGRSTGWRNPRRDAAGGAVDRWLGALGLAPLATRYPDELSGGQRQRVAIARALVAEPHALLLDEPFAALDAPLRGKLRADLSALQAELALPIVLITHDPSDVDTFADDVLAIDAGRTVPRFVHDSGRDLMKTSARNQLVGIVSAVTTGAVNDEVEITLPGGQRIVAVVTRSSAAGLGLVVGAEAFALVKASSVVVVADMGSARLSARNQLVGRVSVVTPGAVNSEVVIDVGGGLSIAAIVTQDSARALGLAVGSAATAIFKASSVIVGVPR